MFFSNYQLFCPKKKSDHHPYGQWSAISVLPSPPLPLGESGGGLRSCGVYLVFVVPGVAATEGYIITVETVSHFGTVSYTT